MKVMPRDDTPIPPTAELPHEAAALADLHQVGSGDARNVFPGQRPSEHVQLCLRQHWLARVGIFLRVLIIGGLPVAGLFVILQIIPDAGPLVRLIFAGVTLAALMYAYNEFIKNELSVILITNERIIEFIHPSLLRHQVIEANLDRIQDVIGYTDGIFSVFFDLGRVEIQTAGRDPFRYRMIHSPHLTARKILNVQRQHLHHVRGVERRRDETESQLPKRAGEQLTDEQIMELRNHRNRRNEDGRPYQSAQGDGI